MSLLRRLRTSQSLRLGDLLPRQSAPSRHDQQAELGLIELGANVGHQRQRGDEIIGVDPVLARRVRRCTRRQELDQAHCLAGLHGGSADGAAAKAARAGVPLRQPEQCMWCTLAATVLSGLVHTDMVQSQHIVVNTLLKRG